MIDTIVVFGDSFNYGHGCKDRIFYYDQNQKKMIGSKCPENSPSQYSWPSLLQQRYPDIKVLNFANFGRSNQQIFRDFLAYSESTRDNKNKENHLVFFQITNPDRIEILRDGKDIASYVLSNADMHNDHVGQTVRSYIRDMYHPSIGENLGFMTILSAFALAKIQKIYNFYWSCYRGNYPWETYDFLMTSVDLKSRAIVDIRNYDFSNNMDHEYNRLYRCVDNHTNEEGHAIYMEKVIENIVKRHLNTK